MPILVSYDDVSALGPLALTAGYQQGFGQEYAQGRERQLDRRSQDQRFLLGNTFENQRLGMQQNFAADQANQSRAFQGYEAEQNRQAQAESERSRQEYARSMDATNFAQAQSLEQQRSANDASRQAYDIQLQSDLKGVDEQRKNDLERNQFIDNAVRLGKSPQDAQREWSQIMVDKTAATGAFARRGAGGGGGGEFDSLKSMYGTMSGKDAQDAGVVTHTAITGMPGAISSYLQHLEKLPGSPAEKAAAVDRALAYTHFTASNGGYNPQQLTNAILHENDPRAKAALQAALTSQVMNSAVPVNQRQTPTTGGPGVGYGGGASVNIKPASQMTDEELLQADAQFK